mgnify:CR=1 FL=1
MQELLLLVLMFGLVACADPEDPPPVATKSAVLMGTGAKSTGSPVSYTHLTLPTSDLV